MLIVVPDVNVLVSKLNADRAVRSSTISQKVVRHLVSGSIIGEPAQIAMSFKMIDTYREVLLRKGYPGELIDESIAGLTGTMKFGPLGFDPHIVLGGMPDPALKDSEDEGVLATAYAAYATILIMDNLKNFAGQDADVFVGGFPIVVNDEVVGGIGLSGGNGEQDTACGVAALQELLAPSNHRVLVQADIKM